jgi:hypothetical protein
MDDVPALIRRLLEDPGRPRVTWYGPDGERVELSGKVLDNWVAKTANLLVDELDAGPGSRVVVDLPPHWRTVVWLLAVWSTGACVVVEDLAPGGTGDGPGDDGGDGVGVGAAGAQDGGPVDILVTAEPAGAAALSWAGKADRVVAVALSALAASFGPGLPDDALDAAVEVRTFGDVFVPFVRPTPSDQAYVATRGGDRPSVLGVPYGELLRFVSAQAGLSGDVRLLTGGPGTDVLLDLLGPLVAEGSVVLHHAPASLDEPAAEHLRAQEGVTVTRFRPR